jgi:transketolase
MALALGRGNPARVFVLMGDGEQAEGAVWEAAMAAAKFKLGNLTAIIDRNFLQISGPTEDVMPLNSLAEKYRAFGWACRVCDGHAPEALIPALTHNRPPAQPLALIAETVKGYGSPVMENKPDWHHRVPDEGEYRQIKADLEIAAEGV